MSWMDRLPRPKALAPTYGPTDDRSYYPGGSFYGALPIESGNPDSAMRLITVQNCVRVRAATMALLPCHVFETLGDDDFREARDFYLYKLLNDRPNSWMTAPIFWSMVEAFVCLRGNFIAYKLGLDGRPVQQLIPITDKVQKIEQHKDYSITYHTRFSNGETIPLPQSKVMHIRGLLTFDGITGVNPIEFAWKTIGLGKFQTEFLSRFFSKGMHPGAIIEYPAKIGIETRKNLGAALREEYAGLSNSQELMLLDDGMKMNWPTIKLVDAQYLELMKMTEAQICGLYRTPLMLVQSGDKTPTFASAEQFDLNYSKYGVAPDCRNYAKTAKYDLMTPSEQEKYYIEFNMDGLLAGDFKTRMEGFVSGVNAEIFCPNEPRGKMGFRPYKGGEIFKSRTSTVKETKDTNTPDDGKKGAAK